MAKQVHKKSRRHFLHRRHIVPGIILFGIGAFLLFTYRHIGAGIQTPRYINPATGSDTTTCTDIAHPCKTFQYAATAAQPGDTLFVRGGTYLAASTSTFLIHDIAGSSTARTVIKPYTGETVILDGGSVPFGETQPLVQLRNVSNFEFDGFEVRNSVGRGISFSEARNIRIADNKVHGIYSRAIGGWADGAIIENNEVYDNALSNLGNTCTSSCSGWPGIIQTASRYGSGPPQEPARNWIIRGNNVHDNWGEGILPSFADGVQIVGNRVANNYSVNIYLSHARNILIDKNYIYVDTEKFNRSGRHAGGISFASESDDPNVPKIKSEYITITNNIITGTYKGINYWNSPLVDPVNSYGNITIIHNTIGRTQYMPLFADAVSGDPAGPVTVENNIITVGPGGAYSIANLYVWTFRSNVWTPSKPANTTFASDYSLSTVPFTSPVTGGDEQGFALLYQLPYTGAATNITSDYFNAPRSPLAPTIGAIEYGAQPSPTGYITPTGSTQITNTPTPAADIYPPVVVITNPADGSTLPAKGTIYIAATATDASGISSMTIYVDGAQKKTCSGTTQCSYSLNVSKMTSGSHMIAVRAIDASPDKLISTATITVTKTSSAKR